MFCCCFKFVLFCFVLVSSGSGPEERRALALCSRMGDRVCPRPWTEVQPPAQPSEAQPGSPRLQQAPPLSPDACYLHTHLWTNGQPVGSWSPLQKGALLSGLCLAIWAGAPGGVPRWRQLSPFTPWGFQPQNEQLPEVRIQASETPSRPTTPSLTCFIIWVRSRIAIPIEQIGKPRLREGM